MRGCFGRKLTGLLLLTLMAGAPALAANRPLFGGRPRAMASARAAAAQRPAGPVAHYGSDVAVAWFDLLYHSIRAERLGPTIAARVIGYHGVALYESVVAGMPRHRSLAGQLNELHPAAAGRMPGAHWPSVANAAMAEMMRSFFSAASQPTRDAIEALEQQIGAGFGPRVSAKLRTMSAHRGRQVAAHILAWSAEDGYAAATGNCPYTPPVGDGLWEPTPPLFRPALHPCWGDLRPFVLSSGGECAPPPPPAYSTEIGSAFRSEGQEVYDVTSALTDDQKAIAQFWSDDPGTTGTPPGHWISIVSQLAQRDGWSLEKAAEAYARVGLGVADAFITCWACKFEHNLLRPITYINDVIDPAWAPLLGTPPFPEYTSGHSTQSGAAALLLTDLLGAVPFVDHTHDFRGLAPRAFASFEEAADEAAISRLYGGIHYRSAIATGLEQGTCVGEAILDKVQFRRR